MKQCGDFLTFKEFSDGSLKLHQANFCKIRLCPMCAWRRTLKIYGQASKIMDVLTESSDYQFIFLTLTMRNCSGSELKQSIDDILSAYLKLIRLTRVKKCVLGAFRALEVTHNVDKKSKFFNTYHPHIHIILCVNKSYFHKDYIKQREWSFLWQACLDVDYEPRVDVRKIKGDSNNIQKAVAEVSKYAVKDAHFLNQDTALQDEAISFLSPALSNRRLISFSGVFAQVQKSLNLDDAIDGDLINCDIDDLRPDVAEFVLVTYKWHPKDWNYMRLDDNNEFVRKSGS